MRTAATSRLAPSRLEARLVTETMIAPLLLSASRAAALTLLRRELLWDLARSGSIRVVHPFPHSGRRWKYLRCDLCRLNGQPMTWQTYDDLPHLVPAILARQVLGLTRREWASMIAFKILKPILNHQHVYVTKTEIGALAGRLQPAVSRSPAPEPHAARKPNGVIAPARER